MGFGVSFWKKRKLCTQNLTKEWKQPPVAILQFELLQYIYSVLVAEKHQRIRSGCFVHEFFFIYICFKFHFIWLWLLIGIMKRFAERCTLQLYRATLSIFILFQLQSWIILAVRTKFLLRNFHSKRVITKKMIKILNNCISGGINNNYFPLNESSSL